MKHLDLFSGIGGFALAASWVWGAEHEIHSFVEIEPFCQKVLKKHWPDVPIHDDIRSYKHDGTAIDLFTGGFPCQPFSVAGKRRGAKDDRFLWPNMLRIIQESRPSWVIGENVAGFINMELEQAISDLEACGYEVEALNIPACSINADHERQRIWIVANSNGIGLQKIFSESKEDEKEGGEETIPPRCFRSHRIQNRERVLWDGEPGILRVCDGLPNRMDRIKGLGNAIVPQVVVPIMEAIRLLYEPNNSFQREQKALR